MPHMTTSACQKSGYVMAKQSKISVDRLLQLWSREDEWKRYHVVRDDIRKRFPELKNVSDRTIMRYLSLAVDLKILEKRIEKDHSTWYKPKNDLIFQKQLTKEKIDEMPFLLSPSSSLEISHKSLKTSLVLPKWLAKLTGRPLEEQGSIPSYYSARVDSKLAKEWRKYRFRAR